jgi:hypothetical protein
LLVLLLDAREVGRTNHLLGLWTAGWDIFFELLLQFDLFKYCFLGKALVEIASMVSIALLTQLLEVVHLWVWDLGSLRHFVG